MLAPGSVVSSETRYTVNVLERPNLNFNLKAPADPPEHVTNEKGSCIWCSLPVEQNLKNLLATYHTKYAYG